MFLHILAQILGPSQEESGTELMQPRKAFYAAKEDAFCLSIRCVSTVLTRIFQYTVNGKVGK